MKKIIIAIICIVLVAVVFFNKETTTQDIYTIEQKQQIYSSYYHELSSKIIDRTYYTFHMKVKDHYECNQEINSNYSQYLFTIIDPYEQFEIRYDDQHMYLNTDLNGTQDKKAIRSAYHDNIKEILSSYELDLHHILDSIEVDEITKTDIISKDRYYFDQLKLKVHILDQEYIVSDERYIDNDGQVKVHPSYRNLIRFNYQDDHISFDLTGEERNYDMSLEELEYEDVDLDTFIEKLDQQIKLINIK